MNFRSKTVIQGGLPANRQTARFADLSRIFAAIVAAFVRTRVNSKENTTPAGLFYHSPESHRLVSIWVRQCSALISRVLTNAATPIESLRPRCWNWALGLRILLCLACGTATVPAAPAAQTVARIWDERALAAIRADTPHPPAQARNLFSLSVCMYDAWAAYDPVAVGYVYRGKHTAADVAAARREAISYAAYRLLKERHVYSKTAAATLAADDAQMTALGYDLNNQSRDPSTPAGLGNAIYDAVSTWFINDGANQAGGTPYPQADPPVAYPDFPVAQGGYVYVNPPLAVLLPGINDGFGNTVVDINHWQRLQIVNAVDQNGFPQGPIQNYLGAQWLGVRPFALTRMDPTKPWVDPGPPPYFGGPTHAQFVKEIVANITADSQLSPDDGVMMDISPAARGNNSLEFAGNYGNGDFEIYDGHGYTTNPVTGLPVRPQSRQARRLRPDRGGVLGGWADLRNSARPLERAGQLRGRQSAVGETDRRYRPGGGRPGMGCEDVLRGQRGRA